jgi:uncharacterized protein YbbK (DUF523 family)
VEKVLVSACLLGKAVRYDGGHLALKPSPLEQTLSQWREQGRVITVCPEVDAGMSIPRAPAEISHGNGADVIARSAKVMTIDGEDVSDYFTRGASLALTLCQKHDVKIAVLTESSPSCGSASIYDGQFIGKKIKGAGVTAALLQQHGIKVFSQHEVLEANGALLCLN